MTNYKNDQREICSILLINHIPLHRLLSDLRAGVVIGGHVAVTITGVTQTYGRYEVHPMADHVPSPLS